ncbi:hypothetical protein E2C01_004441 [Portunus trituberculatus]|uniref:Uncharacterized protein n=1 Tax=Portunus trituberculatus TaxID=210409 RepID=A0A5B7CU15_PORTR|nr:hypothetical protein [Portunus trituberculatus]
MWVEGERRVAFPFRDWSGHWAGAAVPVNSPDTHQGNLSLPGSEVEEEILFGSCLGMADIVLAAE